MNFNRPIIQYDLEGQELKRFANTKRAARNVGVSEKLIIKHLKGVSVNVLGKWLFRFDSQQSPTAISQALDRPPLSATVVDGPRQYIEPSAEEDHWLTPFERILKRRP